MLLADATLVFMWVPSHVGLAGNSAADTAAKAAELMPISNLTLSYSDYLPLIRTHVLNQWQSSWSLETENKLHAIEPMVNITKSYRLPRRVPRVGRGQLYRLSFVDAHTVAQNQYTGKTFDNVHFFCHGIMLCARV